MVALMLAMLEEEAARGNQRAATRLAHFTAHRQPREVNEAERDAKRAKRAARDTRRYEAFLKSGGAA